MIERCEVGRHLREGVGNDGLVRMGQVGRVLQLLQFDQQGVIGLLPVIRGCGIVAAIGLEAADGEFLAQRSALAEPFQARVSLAVQFGVGGDVAQAIPSDIAQNPRDDDEQAEAQTHLGGEFHVLEHRGSPALQDRREALRRCPRRRVLLPTFACAVAWAVSALASVAGDANAPSTVLSDAAMPPNHVASTIRRDPFGRAYRKPLLLSSVELVTLGLFG